MIAALHMCETGPLSGGMRGRLDFCIRHNVCYIARPRRAIGVGNAKTGEPRGEPAHGLFNSRLEVFGGMSSKVIMVGGDVTQRAGHFRDVDRI